MSMTSIEATLPAAGGTGVVVSGTPAESPQAEIRAAPAASNAKAADAIGLDFISREISRAGNAQLRFTIRAGNCFAKWP
jgi:hypothetical protein